MPSLFALLGLVLLVIGILIVAHVIAGGLLFGVVVGVVGIICLGVGGRHYSGPRV